MSWTSISYWLKGFLGIMYIKLNLEGKLTVLSFIVGNGIVVPNPYSILQHKPSKVQFPPLAEDTNTYILHFFENPFVPSFQTYFDSILKAPGS